MLTHGFLIDLDGRKMSKSIGNTILPQEIIEESGAEVLRLWVISTDYRDELRVSKEILARVVEAYRKIRNTCRILVANLYDFDPATDSVTPDALEAVDRYALARYAEAASKMRRAYDAYDFPVIFHALNALRDRGPERILRGRLEGPPVYAGRRVCEPPRGADRDVHNRRRARAAHGAGAARYRRAAVEGAAGRTGDLGAHGAVSRCDDARRARQPRADGGLAEAPRAARPGERRDRAAAKGEGGGHLARARLTIEAWGDDYDRLRRYAADLPTLFIVSEVMLIEAGGDGPPRFVAERATGVKCDRCWRYVPAVSAEPGREGLCDRCVEARCRAGRGVSHGADQAARSCTGASSGRSIALVIIADQITKLSSCSSSGCTRACRSSAGCSI